ncbi:MAG: AraC family transcriptional regulator [Eubacteriales bacterium]|nr:AraC family transcriptional regulator [Eubacteriales bacterium]
MPQIPAAHKQPSCFPADHPPRLAYVCLWTFENGTMARTMHRHSDICEVLLTVEGRGVHTINGQRYRTERGDLLIYNSSVVHEDNSQPGCSERTYCCGVENLHLTGLAENCLLPRGAELRLRTGARFSEFETMFRLIYEHTAQPRLHSNEIAQQLLLSLLLMIMQLGHEAAESERPESAQVDLMRGYIDTHYAEDISLEQIAAQAGISAYYASHLFKEYCGYSPMQYTIRRRIGEAQSLLLLSSMSVTQIAAQTGFDSPNHFSTIFSKHTGYSPSAYRKTFLRSNGGETRNETPGKKNTASRSGAGG